MNPRGTLLRALVHRAKPALIAVITVWLSVGGGWESAPFASPGSAQIAPPIFDEVAARVGLDFYHFPGATGQYYFPEIAGAGVGLIDFDNDGDLDVYLVQGTILEPGKSAADASFPPPKDHWPGNRLYRNELIPKGELRFIDVTTQAGVGHAGYGMGLAVGDIDNDGDPDLYVTNFGDNVLYRNDGNGSFTDITEASGAGDPRWSTSAAFVDYDRDGDLDLYVANYVAFRIANNERCTGALDQRDYCGPQVYEPVSDSLFRNDGGGRFTDVSSVSGIDIAQGSGLGVTSADFNGDGWPDIYVANDKLANQLWMNQKDGGFVDTALMAGAAYSADGVAEAGMGVTAGDFDSDGDEDLFMTHLAAQTNTLYVNEGAADFVDATAEHKLASASLTSTGFGTEWFDFDNDGLLDLFAANGAVELEASRMGKSDYPYEQTNQLFRQTQPGKFADISRDAGPAMQLLEVSRGAAFGDIDNDGDVDIVATNNNGRARLLLNQVGSRNHWLTVRLRAVSSNRDAVGARVGLVRRGRTTAWRRVHTDGSYLSANDIRVHFGLGADAAIAGVVVQWPGGSLESFRGIAADGQVTLVQGTGDPVAPDP